MYRLKKEYHDAQVNIAGSRLVINKENIADPAVQAKIVELMKFHPQVSHNFEEGDPSEPYEETVVDPLDQPVLGSHGESTTSNAAPAGVPAESVADALAEIPAEERDPAAVKAVEESTDVAASPSTKQQGRKSNK